MKKQQGNDRTSEFEYLSRRYKEMSPDEKRAYNHQRYLRKKEEYKRRSREQYERLKASLKRSSDDENPNKS